MKGRRHTPEQVVHKLREADRQLAEGDRSPISGPYQAPMGRFSGARSPSFPGSVSQSFHTLAFVARQRCRAVAQLQSSVHGRKQLSLL